MSVDYNVITNRQYLIDSVSTEIASPILDSIYKQNRENSILKKGKPFVFDDFEKEEARLVGLFRNSGIYHFKSYSLGFWTDSIKKSYMLFAMISYPEGNEKTYLRLKQI